MHSFSFTDLVNFQNLLCAWQFQFFLLLMAPLRLKKILWMGGVREKIYRLTPVLMQETVSWLQYIRVDPQGHRAGVTLKKMERIWSQVNLIIGFFTHTIYVIKAFTGAQYGWWGCQSHTFPNKHVTRLDFYQFCYIKFDYYLRQHVYLNEIFFQVYL